MAKRKKKTVSRTVSRKRIDAELRALSAWIEYGIFSNNPEVNFVRSQILVKLHNLQLKTQGKKKFSNN